MSYRCHTVQEIWGDGVMGAVLCLIDATLYRRYGEMIWWCCIMSYRCHTVQEIWGDGVVGAVLCLIGATLYRRYGEMVWWVLYYVL